jgi:hypothetical protein
VFVGDVVVPHCGQNATLAGKLFPQVGQNIVKFPVIKKLFVVTVS